MSDDASSLGAASSDDAATGTANVTAPARTNVAETSGATGAKVTEEADGATTWLPPEAAAKVPAGWGAGAPTKKGVGLRWKDPEAPKANHIRIDKGNPANSQPTQQVDHVIVQSAGKIIGRDGKPIRGAIDEDAVNAHIPLSEWLTWARWNSPS